MHTITITLVQTDDGRLVGRTRSDAWNLATLVPGVTMWADRNGIAAKRLRRMLAKEYGTGFKVVIGRGCVRDLVERPSRAEVDALGPVLASVVQPVCV
jgi:hypothetical protein